MNTNHSDMQHDYTETDQLIAKYLAGEANQAEIAQLETWRAASADNQKYFAESKWLWEQATPQITDIHVDTDAALQQVKAKLSHTQQRARTRKLTPWLMGVAASLALLVAAWWNFKTPQSPENQIFATTSYLRDTLTDGSCVTLNKQSGLVITRNFGQNERRVKLTGEAFFQVQSDAQKTFIVETGKLEVRVVGTQFHVATVLDTTTVTVTEGKVAIQFEGKQLSLLTAGQAAKFRSDGTFISAIQEPNLNVAAYATRQFRFERTELQTVLNQIADTYHINLKLENQALAQCPLTARFDQQSLEQITTILQETFGFEVVKDAQTIIFKGGTCD
jgi:transmembrane sensor